MSFNPHILFIWWIIINKSFLKQKKIIFKSTGGKSNLIFNNFFFIFSIKVVLNFY